MTPESASGKVTHKEESKFKVMHLDKHTELIRVTKNVQTKRRKFVYQTSYISNNLKCHHICLLN